MSEESSDGPVFTVPTRARLTLRRSVAASTVVGALGLIAGGLVGQAAFAAFACVGLLLGATNTLLVQRSILKESAAANPSRGSLLRGVGARLAVITGIAVVLSVVFFPAGLGAFLGLAVFQVITTLVGAIPALKELRQ